ncbi:MAG: DUF4956 domain-containing protein [Coriobacteriia bacterium]|nr:DUF4956 domain-containing protein [Coriobacteriia bacterium]
MERFFPFVLDLLAIVIMTFALYFPRHRRKDMVVSYLGANIGVAAVAAILSSSTVAVGLGLGLFGILSIIRLRSDELNQPEVAYYFASLALGLLAGVSVTPLWLSPVLTGAILLALFIGDHPRLFARHRNQIITLDAAFTNEAALIRHLEELLGATVHVAIVRKLNLVNETTVAEVHYELPRQVDEYVAEQHGIRATEGRS